MTATSTLTPSRRHLRHRPAHTESASSPATRWSPRSAARSTSSSGTVDVAEDVDRVGRQGHHQDRVGQHRQRRARRPPAQRRLLRRREVPRDHLRLHRASTATTLTGDLTIKGVTKSVTVAFEFNGAATDPFGNLRAGFEGPTDDQPQRLGPHLERRARDRRRAGLREDQARPRRAARQAGLSHTASAPGPPSGQHPLRVLHRSHEAAALPFPGEGGGLRRAEGGSPREVRTTSPSQGRIRS